MGAPMISIRQAAKDGHTRLRMPHWSSALDHIEISIHDGLPGPWAKLWCPFNEVCNGRDPVLVMLGAALAVTHCIDPGRRSWVIYDGPLPDSVEYRQECQRYAEFNDFVTKGKPYERYA